MATHDYVIANGTGAAVRSDLNDALAAIVSNNSSSSEPATTYAYQWWADTTNNLLKLRNSANNAWITLRELDGTLLMEDGSASAPGLSFASDTNTGFFSGGADKIGFATGGAERLEIGSSEVVFNDPSNDVDFRVESNGNTHMLFVDGGNNKVGIGTSSPSDILTVAGSDAFIKIDRSNGNPGIDFRFNGSTSNRGLIDVDSGGSLKFAAGGNTERARIDSSGRLLVGTSSARSVSSLNSSLQVEGTGGDSSTISVTRNVASAAPPRVVLGKSRGTSVGSSIVVQSGDSLGEVSFSGADGTDANSVAATILCQVDGTPGSNDMPGRLMFKTTADGASSPTERMRIDSSGRAMLGRSATDTSDSLLIVQGNAGDSGTGGQISIQRGGSANPTSPSELGSIAFKDSAGSRGVVISAVCDGDWAASDFPGRLEFKTTGSGESSPTERMRISAGGRIGIANTLGGTQDLSNSNLSVYGNSDTATGSVPMAVHAANTASERYMIVFFNGNGNVGNIRTNGSSTSYNTSSDYRLKENVVGISDGIARVKQLQPKRFNFIADADTTVDGFLAHEAQAIVPEAVSGTHNQVQVWDESEELPDGVSVGDNKLDEDGNTIPEYQGIDQSKLVPLLTAALQEAIAKIETLETKVAALEAG